MMLPLLPFAGKDLKSSKESNVIIKSRQVIRNSGEAFSFVYVCNLQTDSEKAIPNEDLQKSGGSWQHQWKNLGVANRISLRNCTHGNIHILVRLAHKRHVDL